MKKYDGGSESEYEDEELPPKKELGYLEFIQKTKESVRTHGRSRSLGVRLSVISRLVEGFRQRAQVFEDDTKLLMKFKSGTVEANLNP
ncbi:hypothetical protein Bca52824_023477 [Brassica carinata]|uniref:Uncharacterized protein n=1 Tax=Brassica carinata TaxID=52824 RepID=A0A8X8AT46_BRACI|nr:hypothetical protein Bca52824_023477 [Brassica carinata]